MLPRFDGLCETSQQVFRKNPLHVSRTERPVTDGKKPHELTGSAHWSSTGGDYGWWSKDDGTAENRAFQDLAKTWVPKSSQKLNRSASDSRLRAPSHVTWNPSEVVSAFSLERSSPQRSKINASSRSFTHNLMQPGDSSPSQAFPGCPGSSLGCPNGRNTMWSFERHPALLHPPLKRDCGRQGRSCAGQPPKAWNNETVLKSPDSSLPSAGGSESPGSRGDPFAAQWRPRGNPFSGSVTSSTSGLQSVIGITWDGAAVSAGGALRGSDGRFLGF